MKILESNLKLIKYNRQKQDMTISSKLFYYTHLGMGAYGVYRGFNIEGSNKISMPERVINSLFNGVMYITPIFNLIQVVKFVNRVEIDYRRLDKDTSNFIYCEINGKNQNVF